MYCSNIRGGYWNKVGTNLGAGRGGGGGVSVTTLGYTGKCHGGYYGNIGVYWDIVTNVL